MSSGTGSVYGGFEWSNSDRTDRKDSTRRVYIYVYVYVVSQQPHTPAGRGGGRAVGSIV